MRAVYELHSCCKARRNGNCPAPLWPAGAAQEETSAIEAEILEGPESVSGPVSTARKSLTPLAPFEGPGPTGAVRLAGKARRISGDSHEEQREPM